MQVMKLVKFFDNYCTRDGGANSRPADAERKMNKLAE